ncbi:hypothetical protein, partial [Pontiella sp.]|uniref:hypothetical protein n=2 Tax=Pontiella sp. TaxID=2837462 RepID=UPI0035686B04
MKIASVLFFCTLLCCNAVMATLSGSDDFDDNALDPTKWTIPFGTGLTETNNRAEYNTPGINEEDDGMWLWTLNSGSSTQDWYIAIEAHNASTPTNHDQNATFELAVHKDWDKSFWVGLAAYGSDDETDRYIDTGWSIGDGDIETFLPISADSATLRISYDSVMKTLTSQYDLGSGFIVATNLSTANWGLTDDDSLNVWIVGFSDQLGISSGQVYGDNFEADALPGISNHLSEVEIDHGIESREPTSSSDDIYDFYIGLLTDTLVSNVFIQCPGGADIAVTNKHPEDGNLAWAYSIESATPTPFFSQFGDGDYVITIGFSNGIIRSTSIPFAQNDGSTPIPDIEEQAAFTFPAPLHGTLFSSPNPTTLSWEYVDPAVTTVEIERWTKLEGDRDLVGLYSDSPLWEPTAPLSTRSTENLTFAPGNWVVGIGITHEAWGTNNAGVFYSCAKGTEAEYHFTVLVANDDYDSDNLPNWWESLYFGGPTNAVASADPDHDGHNNEQEAITGMDPTNALSCFRITNCIPVADDFLIEWPSVS